MNFATQEKNRGGTRKMLSRIRKRFTYANIAMTVVLVFAMSSGAYAASKYLITSTKQISPKVLKSLKGAAGKAGPAGAQGSAGPAGSQGPAGANGKDGISGKDGTPGVNGESVASAEVKPGEATCNKLGGSKFTVGGKETTACNGEKGAKGPQGEPWAPNNELPSEATETGVWTIPTGEEGVTSLASIASFTVQLKSPILNEEECGETGHSACVANIIPEGGAKTAACPGTVEEPQAAPGNFCVYVGKLIHANFVMVAPGNAGEGAGKAGAVADVFYDGAGASGHGSWAVTAE